MYKDVKKKIIALVLSICMVAAVIEVVPIVRAATNTTQSVSGKFSGGASETYTVKINSATFSYNGMQQLPSLTEITGASGSPLSTDRFRLTLKNGDEGINAGTHELQLIDSQNDYVFSGSINYEITKAVVNRITAPADIPTQIWNKQGVTPDISGVKVGLADGSNVTLSSSQFKIDPVSGVGTQETTLTLTDGNNLDLSSSTTTVRFSFDVAYDLSGSIAAGTSNYNVTLASTSATYDGTAKKPDVQITDETGTPVVKAADYPGNFTINYYNESGARVDKMVESGNYTVEMIPKSGASGYTALQINGNRAAFTGTFRASYRILPRTSAALEVYANNSQGVRTKIFDGAGGDVETLSLSYVDGVTAVRPEDIVVIDKNLQAQGGSGNITDQCDFAWDNDTGVGNAKIVITPKASTNIETTSIEIYYFITSKLSIQSISFPTGETLNALNTSPLVYSGKAQVPTSFVVKNAAGNTLTKDAQYTCSFSYELDGEWQTPVVDATNDPNFATAGRKKVIVQGKAGYANQPAVEFIYTIDRVSMNSPTYAAKFELKITGNTCFYNGKQQTPTFEFTYNGVAVDEKNYRVIWGENINAGETAGSLTVEATENGSFSGSKTVQFAIKRINLDDASMDADYDSGYVYVYNRQEVNPQFKIGDYSLREGVDYEIEGYYDATGKKLDSVPKNVGTYRVRLTNLNTTNINTASKTLIFRIDPMDIDGEGFTLQGVNNGKIEWNGNSVEPKIIGTSLEETVDYTYSYVKNTDVTAASEAAIIINGQGNYKGTKTIHFQITPRGFSSVSGSGFTFDAAVSGTVSPGYEVALAVKDDARVSGQKNLALTTDYTVKQIRYFSDKKNSWEVVDSSDYSTNANSVTGLKRAGRYEITITGTDRYTDDLKTEVTCGTDISEYYAHIDDARTTYVYNGQSITPTAVSLYNSKDNRTDISPDCFDLDYEREDSYSQKLVDAGKIYVIAIGVPEKGYYGRTSKKDRTKSYYMISSPQWTQRTLKITVKTEGGITYAPNNGTPIPTIEVIFDGVTLVQDEDYTLIYDEADLRTAGQKTITVRGINNYDNTTNRSWPASYEVFPVDINQATLTSKDETEYSGGRPDFKLNYSGYDLVEKTDYVSAVSYGALGEDFVYNPDKKQYEITYIVTGKGNFTGECSITIKVNVSDLSDATFAESKESAQVGQYYVVWKKEELLMPSEQAALAESKRTPIKPTDFDLVFKKSETKSVTLKKGTDYEIAGYGTNVTPGYSESNYVSINGINGYSGKGIQLRFILYTDITGAKTTSTSLIQQNGPTITKTDWMRVYAASGEKGLVELQNLSFDEEGGVINPDEYTLNWTSGFDPADPAVGTYTLRISGAQTATHYYGGTFTIDFTVVNSIENAVVSVNGDLNAIRYDGTPAVVTGAGTVFNVSVDGVELRRGIDYKIVGYEHNDEIGMARVKLEGMGNYAGNAYHDFKVIYPLKDLVVFMEDADGQFKNTAEENVRYAYNAQDITPRIHVYCPLDKPAGKEYEDMVPLSASYYVVEYENNKNAGTATVLIKDCPYFSGDTQRSVTFTIEQNSICPPTAGAISYSTAKFANVNNISVGYTGKVFTAEDLGIELRDRGTLLTAGNSGDYVLYYVGDHQNVSDPAHKPEIRFVGVNNYKDEYTISYTITRKSLTDTEIEANPVDITYSGTPIGEEVKSRLNVVQTDIGKTLALGTDYEIEGYYKDSLCQTRVIGNDGIPNAQGKYYVKLVGIGNYDKTRTVEIIVNRKDMSEGISIAFKYSEDCPVSSDGEPLCTYNGKAHEPAIDVIFGRNTILTEGTDYTVSYNNNIAAGVMTAEVVVTGKGNYDGTFTRSFTITPKNIADETVHFSPIDENYPFTRASVEPGNSMTITDLEVSQVLTAATAAADNDYTITYEGEYDTEAMDDGAPLHSYAGEVKMTITGNGNYQGTKEMIFYIGEDISQAYALYHRSASESVTYNGLIQSPDINQISVEKNGLSIAAGSYDIAFYKDEVNKESKVTPDQFMDAGTYYITVAGVPSKGTYAKTPSQNCTYIITPKTIAGCVVSGYAGMYYYTGNPIQPVGITVTDTDLPQSNVASDGKRSVELVAERDFTISYQNNRSAGKATIVASGMGNYTGTVYAYFTIENSKIDNTGSGDSTSQGSISKDGMTTLTPDNIVLTYDDSANNFMRYTGAEVLPTVSFIGGYNRNDFEITGVNNVNPGKATLVIRGKGGNYTGAIYMYFNIKANLSTHATMSAVADQAYTGALLTPHVTVGVGTNILTLNKDYQLTYSNNQNVGRATITAQGVGDYYYGSVSTSFNISNGAGGMSVTGYASSYIYTGNAIAPDVTVTMNGVSLTKNRDYTVTYTNNVNVGTATMTVTGIGSYSGTQTINYTIEAKNIENCTSNAVSNVKYTGNTYTPVITLQDAATGKVLVQGSDYMVTYSNNTNPGTASITITALSKNYVGTKVIPFKITSAAVTGLRTGTIKNNSIRLAWTSQSYADGYQICNAQNQVIATTANTSYTVKNLKSCTTYRYKVRSYVNNTDGSTAYGDFSTAVSAKTMLNTPKLKAASKQRGVVTLTWSKVSKATGYEIYYSTKRNGIYTKLKTVSSSSKRTYYDRGLATGEKYYYTIRAYRKVNGVKTYSNYNTIKAVTVR